MSSVTFTNVSKTYAPDVKAVQDFSLEIRDKEFMVLVGPSGCGKSTLLRMLAGLETVTVGEIRIGDQIVNDVPAHHRDVAMVFQSYALYPHMDVFANMAYPLKVRRLPKNEIEQRVREAARVLGLTDLLHRRPRALSGGQKQRVALGRAILRQPNAFLLDEPLSNLDAKLRTQTRLDLKELHGRLGATFIYVTHDQVEAMTMGDRLAVLRDGVLQQVASPSEIYDRPANVYVAGFIGSPAMNLVPARVRGTRAVASGFEVGLEQLVQDGEVLLGVRPEAFTRNGRGDVTVDLRVSMVERLGSDQYLYGKVGTDSLTARVDPRARIEGGDSIPLGLDRAAIHVFDTATGQRLI
jgi:multiple sugar transport system ATP-binding protein